MLQIGVNVASSPTANCPPGHGAIGLVSCRFPGEYTLIPVQMLTGFSSVTIVPPVWAWVFGTNGTKTVTSTAKNNKSFFIWFGVLGSTTGRTKDCWESNRPG